MGASLGGYRPPSPQRPMGLGLGGGGTGPGINRPPGGSGGGGLNFGSIFGNMFRPGGSGGGSYSGGAIQGGGTRPGNQNPGPWGYSGQVNLNLPPAPGYQNNPDMQNVFGQMQSYQNDLAKNQDMQAQHAMQRQRASNSGALNELADMTLLQQGAGGNRAQQVRNAGFMGQQTMGALNAGLADSARTQQLASLGQLGSQAGAMAGQAQSQQAQNYGQQVYNPAALNLQAQGMNIQAQQAANQSAYQQAVLNQQAAQMQQQNYWNALQMMMGMMGRG